MKLRLFLPLALLAVPLAASAQEAALDAAPVPPLGLEHRMLLRCSAAMAMVAYRQDAGEPAVADYPPLAQRGREFFVRASVQVMDEAGLTREQVQAALAREAQDMVATDSLDAVMPACLALLPVQ